MTEWSPSYTYGMLGALAHLGVKPMSITDPSPAPTTGSGKAVAAVIAGSLATIIVYIVDQFLKTPLPTEIVAAVQTLFTAGAVYIVPHGGNS